MKQLFSSPKFITIAVALIAIIAIPLTIIQVQSQQNLQQEAEGILWLTNQSASATCPADGSGVTINVIFTNTEPKKSSTAMDVTAKDSQSGKSVDMGSIQGGSTSSNTITTGKSSLKSGSVTFLLTWTDGHKGSDSRTASYKSVSNCAPQPTATPTPYPTGQPTPTPTICPTLAPVKNVHIDCPNCAKQ